LRIWPWSGIGKTQSECECRSIKPGATTNPVARSRAMRVVLAAVSRRNHGGNFPIFDSYVGAESLRAGTVHDDAVSYKKVVFHDRDYSRPTRRSANRSLAISAVLQPKLT